MSCPFGYGSAGNSENTTPLDSKKVTTYTDYLAIGELLKCQRPESFKTSKPAHDEMLFIIIHQTYELWFKQILFEIDSVIEIFNKEFVPEEILGTVLIRLDRVCEIQKILVNQIQVLETMTPLDFLEFRNLLGSSSGFQSVQFRLFENKLGLLPNLRLQHQQTDYVEFFEKDQKQILCESHNQSTLLKCIEKWLERIPFLNDEKFDFWQNYKQAVYEMLQEDKLAIENNYALIESEKQLQLQSIDKIEETFKNLFDEQKWNVLLQRNERRLSFRAIQSALLISLYREQHIFQLPFRVLTALQNIDSQLTLWRYRHSEMVHRMIGSKIGTGGSSGYHYLRSTATTDRYRVFSDLFQLPTFLIPRSKLPILPSEFMKKLRFSYTN
eukprot:TRINITY_DN524_c0_g2_i1.p1 TRINITY_DN524_c0_g2~~TRINITY_DN524_c0_g2_i1.p1  ORF type:complete len:383 (-),score=177.17 TRINITY_DN524_c0_g2_i1:122-1270(-)